MLAFGTKQIFDCNESMCWGAEVRDSQREPKRDDYGRVESIPVDLVMRHIWFIRPGIELINGYTEEGVVAAMKDHGIAAEWVDSESDARAMSGMPV